MKTKKRIIMAILAGIVSVSQAALVGEWNFDGQNFTNSGTSGAVHDGTFVTTNSNYFSTDAIGGSGYSLRIQSIEDADNVDTTGGDVLLINNSSTSSGGYLPTFDGAAFTVSMWVKSLDNNWTKWDEIAGKQVENWGSSPNAGWSLRSELGNTMRFDAYGAGTAQSTSDALDLNWHLVTATYDGSTMNIYIDGQPEGSTSSAISNASPYALAFGAREDGSRGEDVLIDEIQYYDEALSATEVLALYTPQDFLFVTPTDIALELAFPSTTVTGSVAVSYISDSDVEVSVSITKSTHPGAFSVLSATPQTLTEPSPSSTVFEVEFDNSLAGLLDGETASCEAIFAWNVVGSAVVTEVPVPITVLYSDPDENISIEELGFSPDAVNPLDLTAEGSADWVMLGQGGSISNRDEKAGADYIEAVTVIGTHGAYAGNAYLSSWSNGSPTATATDVQGGWEVKPPAVDGKQALTFSVDGLSPGDYTMKLYCSRYRATATLTATNNTAVYSADFDDGGVGPSTDSNYGVFTVNFPVASMGDSLDVSLDVTALGHSVYGNVSITAITLQKAILIEELGSDPAAVNPLDLTAEGTSDWVMLGQGGSISSRDEKAGTDYIGAVTVIGTHGAYGGNAYLSNWTDGSPTATASDAQGGWEAKPPAVGGKQALTFSVDGLSPGNYAMKLYCSRYKATGALTASIGTEISGADFNEGGTGSGSSYGVLTVNFPVAFLGESLDVSLDVTALGDTTYGNVSITAITLQQTSETDPEVGDVTFEIISGGTQMAMSFNTTAGYLYGVEVTDDLVDGAWSNTVEDVAGTDSEVIVTNALMGDAGFYRAFIQD
jgi:hypothetical protein